MVLFGVPRLGLRDHNQARRLVTLVDELYEHGVRLVVEAAAPPDALFTVTTAKHTPSRSDLAHHPPGSSMKGGATGTFHAGAAAQSPSTRGVNAPELAGRPLPGSSPMLGRGAQQQRVPIFPASPAAAPPPPPPPGGGDKGLTDEVKVDAAQGTLVLEGELASVQELGFAFRRAASRLVEMAGAPYHRDHARRHPCATPLPPPGEW